ncbi:MAG: hypothetical protein R3B57_14425 [Phycisphaerales bacterium]
MAVALVAIALLALDFAMLPIGSTCKRWVVDRSREYRRRHVSTETLFYFAAVEATRRDGSYEVSEEALSGYHPKDPETSFQFVFMILYHPHGEGWWASTWFSHGFINVADDVPDDAVLAVERYMHRRSGESKSYDAMSRMIEDYPRQGRVVWWGYVHNAGAVVALIGLLASTWVFAVSSRAIARIRRGRCHRCKYDVRDLAGDVCPECSTPVGGTADPEGSREHARE